MAKQAHTPGPWIAEPYYINSLQHCYFVNFDRTEAKWEELKANARLIAAAPDLLNALTGLLNLTDQGREGALILSRADRKPITNGDQDVIDRAFIAAEAAIRKARACEHNTRAFRDWLTQCVDCGEIVNWEPHTEATKFIPSEGRMAFCLYNVSRCRAMKADDKHSEECEQLWADQQ